MRTVFQRGSALPYPQMLGGKAALSTIIIPVFVGMFYLFFALTPPCFGELTEKDVGQIRQIIREEIEPLKIEIATIKDDIKALEGKMATKDDIRKELEPMKIEIATIKGKMATKDDIITMNQKIGDKIDTLYGIIIASFVTLIVVIAVPQILIAYRERRESRLSKEVDELKQRIVELERKNIVT
ncbi:TPA: hypothetical protein EYP66_01140 [Candidatus Poribacteria bacterium]|nr:hypothetical protein [Candidatus Poribacteria bacterium]